MYFLLLCITVVCHHLTSSILFFLNNETFQSKYPFVLLFYQQEIAETMTNMQREGRLLRGEHNLLGEAFLVMASAAG